MKWATVGTLFFLIAILFPLLFEHNKVGKRRRHRQAGIGSKIGCNIWPSTETLTYFWTININWVTVVILFSLLAILLPLLFDHKMGGMWSSIVNLVLVAKLVVVLGPVLKY